MKLYPHLMMSTNAEPLPAFWAVFPFLALLLLIATGPVLYKHFWERYYHIISIVLGAVVALYYFISLNDVMSIIHSIYEYISFIALIGSLFIVTGGILIRISKSGTPVFNLLYLLFGALIANVIGTTGASVLLIRPYLKANVQRLRPYHIIFFIFLVSNIGGGLTPIGDPPLFLGFLRGVPFFWVVGHVWYIWILTVAIVLFIFWFFDVKNNKKDFSQRQDKFLRIEIIGKKNLWLVAIILVSVFFDKNILPWVPDLRPFPLGVREIVMLGTIIAAMKISDPVALKGNEFELEPIKEVAYLFLGLFLTMVPALRLIAEYARVYSNQLAQGSFYWGSGVLSSFLDNAPTYLNFLSAAMGKFRMNINEPDQVHNFSFHAGGYLTAISVASVFFGAMTYIGNGPNFMVKSICERAGMKMPSFFSYMIRFSIPILLPVYFLIWLLFFR